MSLSAFLIFAVIAFTSCVSADTGLRVLASQRMVEFIASSPQLREIIYDPLVASIRVNFPDYQLNTSFNASLTDISFNQSTFKNISAKIENGVGIIVKFIGFSTLLNWTLSWNDQGKRMNLTNSTSITMDMSIVNSLKNNMGNPLFKIVSLNISNVVLVKKNYSIPIELQNATYESIIILLNTNSTLSSLQSTISNYITTSFGDGYYSLFLADGGLVNIEFDYHLSEDIAFDSDYLSIGSKGDIQIHLLTPCTRSHNLSSPLRKFDFEIYFSSISIDCLLSDVKFALGTVVPLLISNYVSNFSFSLDMPGEYNVTFAPGYGKEDVNTKIFLPLSVDISRLLDNKKQQLISLYTNITLDVDPKLNVSEKTIGLTASALVNDIYCDPKSLGPIPEEYRQQIINENWKMLAQQFNDILKDKIISRTIPLPDIIGKFLEKTANVAFDIEGNQVILRGNLK